MYRYKECGLPNVRLANGYTVHKTAHGRGVSIVDVDGLHRVIGLTLASKPKLTGSELRFLRKELDWSQRMLGAFVGATEQSVSLWERHGKVPAAASRLTQLLYREKIDGNVKIQEVVQKLAGIDRRHTETLLFEQKAHHWREAA